MKAEKESWGSSFPKAETWTFPLLAAGQGRRNAAVWPLCSPDADGSRSFSIRLLLVRNLEEPQDLRGWESLMVASRDMTASSAVI